MNPLDHLVSIWYHSKPFIRNKLVEHLSLNQVGELNHIFTVIFRQKLNILIIVIYVWYSIAAVFSGIDTIYQCTLYIHSFTRITVGPQKRYLDPFNKIKVHTTITTEFCIISNFVLSHFHDTCVFLVPGLCIKVLIFGPGPCPITSRSSIG